MQLYNTTNNKKYRYTYLNTSQAYLFKISDKTLSKIAVWLNNVLNLIFFLGCEGERHNRIETDIFAYIQ